MLNPFKSRHGKNYVEMYLVQIVLEPNSNIESLLTTSKPFLFYNKNTFCTIFLHMIQKFNTQINKEKVMKVAIFSQ